MLKMSSVFFASTLIVISANAQNSKIGLDDRCAILSECINLLIDHHVLLTVDYFKDRLHQFDSIESKVYLVVEDELSQCKPPLSKYEIDYITTENKRVIQEKSLIDDSFLIVSFMQETGKTGIIVNFLHVSKLDRDLSCATIKFQKFDNEWFYNIVSVRELN